MDITLDKWIQVVSATDSGKIPSQKVADVLSQILGSILDGNYGISLKGCSLSFDDSESITDADVYGSLICSPVETYTEEDGDFIPHNYCENDPLNEKSAVYVAGLLLYYMVTLNKPVISIFDKARSQGPLYTVTNTRFDTLVSGLTEAVSEVRMSAEQALDMLAQLFPADAKIFIVDKESDAVIASELITLSGAFTRWVCGSDRYKFRGKKYFFSEKSIEIRYRSAGLSREVKASIFNDNISVESKHSAKGKYIGVDIGSSRTKIAVFEDKNIHPLEINGEFSIETAISGDRGKYYFLCDESDETLVKNSDGSEKEVTRQMAAESFMRRLRNLSDNYEGICFTYSGKYTELLDNARDAVFGDKVTSGFVSPLRAVGAAFANENEFVGNVVFVDIGEAAARVGVMKCDSYNDTADWIIENSFLGGISVTDNIYDKILLHLDAVNIPMRNHNDSKLVLDKYKHNIAVMRATAENIKCAMAFAQNNTPLQVEMGLSRPGNMVQPVVIDSAKCDLAPVIAKYKDYIIRMIRETISQAKLSEQMINCVVIYGRSAALPGICDGIHSIFSGHDCLIKEDLYDISAQARGTALCAYYNITGKNDICADRLYWDIGIAVSSVLGGMPEFRTVLSSSEPLVNGKAAFEYRTEITINDIEDGCYKLRLYQRNKGDDSLYINAVGSSIRYLGCVEVDISDSYNFSSDLLQFEISVDINKKLTANVSVVRKANISYKLKRMLLNGEISCANSDYYVVNTAVSRTSS